MESIRPLPCPYEMRVLHSEDFAGFYLPEWSNALCEKRRELDVLGFGAYNGDKLIGLAGCSADCEMMWQIGVDVLPEYRRQGVASALTSRLALEILDAGKVPFYCAAWSNIKSVRNAIRSGFRPAWGGISEDKEVSICVSAEHKTTKNILARKAFTVSMATAEYVTACDYVGVVSGNKEPDKFAKAGFHATKSELVDAPLIDELPMAVECRLISYDPETCRLVGEIVNVSADESVLNENGKVDPAKLRPITYDPMNHYYLALGEKVGRAFKDGLELK